MKTSKFKLKYTLPFGDRLRLIYQRGRAGSKSAGIRLSTLVYADVNNVLKGSSDLAEYVEASGSYEELEKRIHERLAEEGEYGLIITVTGVDYFQDMLTYDLHEIDYEGKESGVLDL
jgi:hypothetical protein